MGSGFHGRVGQSPTSINGDIVGYAKLLKEKVTKSRHNHQGLLWLLKIIF